MKGLAINLAVGHFLRLQHNLHSTQDDQEHIVSQWQQHAGVSHITLEDDSLSSFW